MQSVIKLTNITQSLIYKVDYKLSILKKTFIYSKKINIFSTISIIIYITFIGL